jgi:hypothetical protein
MSNGEFSFSINTQTDGLTNIQLYDVEERGGSVDIDWGNGSTGTVALNPNTISQPSSGPIVTISGDNSSHLNYIRLESRQGNSITGITGTLPSELSTLFIKFNYANPTWVLPNVRYLDFLSGLGPSSITTGSQLVSLVGLPPNLSYLDVSSSTMIELPEELLLPSGLTGVNFSGIGTITYLNFSNLTSLTTFILPPSLKTFVAPPGITELSGLPSGIISIDFSACNALTDVLDLPSGLVTLRTPPGITSLPTLPSSLLNLTLTPPVRITGLFLSECIGMSVLPTLPSGLQFLSTPGGITTLTNLPSTLLLITLTASTILTTLDLSNCPGLVYLPTLPSGLLTFTTTPGITSLPTLPSSLVTLNLTTPGNMTSLNLSQCINMSVLPTLPSGLQSLSTPGGITGLTGLPSTITNLDLRSSRLLTSFPIPSGLQYLFTPPGITGLSGLPSSLLSINLSGSTGIKGINLSGCNKLTTLPTLPSVLTSLNVSGCTGLTSIPSLPNGLVTLDISRCNKPSSLPTLPSVLRNLNISECTGLTGLPTLPSVLTSLNVSGCTGLTSIPSLPNGLVTLDISRCNNPSSLPTLPSVLRNLNISECTGLTGLPQLPATLTRLQVENSGLRTLDLTGTNVATFDIPPSMVSKLTYLKLTGSKVRLSGLLKYQIPAGSQWILY